MRPYVKIVEGRMFRPGVNEVIVARRIRDRFVNTAIGDSFKFGTQNYNVVGVFDAQGTAFDSEMWCDADFLGQARKRDALLVGALSGPSTATRSSRSRRRSRTTTG